MAEIDIELIKRKSLTGIVALTSRTFLLQIIAFGATFLLTIFLTPAIFGIFYVVSAIISFLAYFSDIGLAAALIQKKEELSEEDLTTTFTIQQILVLTVVIIALLFSQTIVSFYHLETSGLWLFRALVVAFFLSSLKTIPSIILERRLDFKALVIPQILETVAFYLVAVILAWRNLGIVSFTWAVMARAIAGLVAIYALQPWRIKVGIRKEVFKKLIRFGIPFQMNSLVGLLKDDLMTVFLGKILPFAQVGYLGWAKKWAEVPLRLFLDSVVRVTFPAFSRLQHSAELLAKGIEKTLFGLSLLIFPVTIGLLFFVQPMVTLIPRYGKWEPAIFAFYLFAVTSAIAGLTSPLTNALNAIGKIKITLSLMIMWTILTWFATITLIHFLGFEGFAWALFLVSFTIVLVVYLVKKHANFSFWKSIRYPLLGAAVQGTGYFLLRGPAPYTWIRLSFAGSVGVILYAGIVWIAERQRIRQILSTFTNQHE